MLNPKAIRTKGQLNKVKKGGSSEGGFPKTDYTQGFNEFIGIDKLTDNTQNNKQVAPVAKKDKLYKSPLDTYVPIGENIDTYITPEKQAEEKVLADIEVYKARNLKKGIVIDYTPEQIKEKIKIQLQNDSDDRAYESRVNAISLNDDELAAIDDEYESIKNTGFALPGESLPEITKLREEAKSKLKQVGVKNITDDLIDSKAKEIFKNKKEADIALSKSNELLRNSTPEFKEAIKRSIARKQDVLGIQENKNFEFVVASQAKAKEAQKYMDEINRIRKDYFKNDVQVKPMEQHVAENYNYLLKRAKAANDAGISIAKNIDYSVEDKANKLAYEYDLLDREYGRFSERFRDLATTGGNIVSGLYGMGGVIARAANSVYNQVAGEDGNINKNKNSSLLKAVEWFDNKAADAAVITSKIAEESAKKPEIPKNVMEYIDHTSSMLISNMPNLVLLGGLGKAGSVATGALAAGEKYTQMVSETGGQGYIDTAISDGIEEANKKAEKYSDGQYIFAPLLNGMITATTDRVLAGVLKKSANVFRMAEAETGLVKKTAMDRFVSNLKSSGADLLKEEGAELLENIGQNAIDKYMLGKDDVNLLDNSKEVIRDTALMTVLFQATPHIAIAASKPFFEGNTYADIQNNSYKILELTKKLETEDLSRTQKDVINKKIESLRLDNKKYVKSAFKIAEDLPEQNFTSILNNENEMAKLRKEATEIYYSDNTDKNELLADLQDRYKKLSKDNNNILRAANQAFNVLAYGLDIKDKQSVFNLIRDKQRLEESIQGKDETERSIIQEYIKNINSKIKETVLKNGFDSRFVNEKFVLEGGDIDAEKLKKAVKALGFESDVVVFDNNTDVAKFGKDNGLDISETANGQFLKDENTGKEFIVLNKRQIVKNGLFNTGQHEFLHKVLNKAIESNPDLAIHLGKSLWNEVDRYLKGNAQFSVIGERLQQYQRLYESGEYSFGNYIEEVMPLFSEALSNGDIQYNTTGTLVNSIRNIIYKALGLLNIDIEPMLLKLDSGKDIAEFIKEYNKGYAKGEFSKAIQTLAKEGKFKSISADKMNIADDNMFYRVAQEGKKMSAKERADANRRARLTSKLSIDYSSPNLSFEEKMAELQALVDDYEIDEDEYQAEKSNLEMKERMRKKREASGVAVEKPIVKVQDPVKEAGAIVKDNKASVASEKVQSIYNEKGVDGAFDIIKLFKPITARIVDKRRDAPGFDKELLTDEIETGKGGIIDLIRTYKPESGVPLAAYINKQLPLRAIEASRRLLGETFAKDVDEQKGLAATETADEIVTAQLPEKPQYANAIEANVLEQPVIDNIKSKLLSTIRTLKTRIDEGVSMNRTVTPIITEIMAEMGSQADIDLKTAMGGKKDNELRKWLLKNKRYILENMTTTWLMGKGKANKVEGGIPQAIQKRVDGKWLSYPDWVGKKIDRESVSTDLAGRTAGHELVRRLPNAYNNVSNEDFLSQVLEPSGNPIRGRKESLAKAIAEEIAFDLIKADFAEEGELYDAFVANQTRLGVDTAIALIPELNKQAERGNVKYSLDFDQFSSILANSEDIANGLIANNFSKKSIQEAILKYAKIDISDSDANAISRRLIRSTFDKNDEISSITKGLFTNKNINLISEELNKLNDKNLSSSEIVSIVNGVSAGKLKLGTLRDADGNISPLGTKLINTFAEKIKQTKDADRDNEIANFINLTNAAFRNAYNSNKGGKYISNAAYMQKVFGSNTELGKLASNWGSISKTGADGKITTHITLNGKIYKPYEFDVTLAESKKNTLNNLDKLDKQSNTHREAYYNALQTLKNNNDIETALAVISDQRSDLKSSMSLLAEFAGYENGIFNKDNIVWEHRPTRNEIAIESIKFLQGSVSDIQFKRFLNSAKVFAVSNEFNAELNKIARANELITGDSYDIVSKKLDKEILDRNGNPINTNKTGKLSLDTDFNKIIEDVYGVDAKETLSAITARKLGYNKGKFRFFIPPSAEDFVGLLYDFMGKGAKGDEHAKFFQDNLVRPYIEGVQRIDVVRNNIREGYKALKSKYPNESKKIKEAVDGTTFTYDQAIRVYLWKTNGVEIPGLSNKEINKLASVVQRDTGMRAFADELSAASGQINGWVEPGNYWNARSIVSDLHDITEKAGRRNILSEFIENSNEIFSEANLNKIESILGSKYRSALEESLSVMKNGGLGSPGDNISKAWTNWIANANGAIMFLNVRSTILQTIAATNYLNWKENNPIAAAKAFANQPQYWKDFAKIFNSPKLKERRSGLKSDVNEAELANAVNNSQDKARAALSYILKLGYTPTQIADSFAIAIGGATYYRNKFNAYVKAGMSEADAEIAAWDDFDNATEETQQSSDPMRLSQQQRSTAGRLILAFANAPMQYNRIMKKAFRDLKNGRGDTKTNLSKILYYGAVQNIMFSAIQSGLFYLLFDDEEEEDKDKATKKSEKNKDKLLDTVNSMADTILRGSGIAGAVVSTAKNVYMKYKEEEAKPRGGDQVKTFVAAAGISPPLGSKVSKAYSAYRTGKFEKDVIDKQGWGVTLDGKFSLSPRYEQAGKAITAATNLPADYIVDKINSVQEILDSRNKTWQKIAIGLGWKPFEVGAINEEREAIKEIGKENRKQEGLLKRKATYAKKREDKERELDSIANLPEDQYQAWKAAELEKYNKKQEEKEQKKERELDSIANLPEDQYQAWKAEQIKKEELKALKRKIRAQYRSK